MTTYSVILRNAAIDRHVAQFDNLALSGAEWSVRHLADKAARLIAANGQTKADAQQWADDAAGSILPALPFDEGKIIERVRVGDSNLELIVYT